MSSVEDNGIISHGNPTLRAIDYYCAKHDQGCGCVFYVLKVHSVHGIGSGRDYGGGYDSGHSEYEIVCPECKRTIKIDATLAKKCEAALTKK